MFHHPVIFYAKESVTHKLTYESQSTVLKKQPKIQLPCLLLYSLEFLALLCWCGGVFSFFLMEKYQLGQCQTICRSASLSGSQYCNTCVINIENSNCVLNFCIIIFLSLKVCRKMSADCSTSACYCKLCLKSHVQKFFKNTSNQVM